MRRSGLEVTWTYRELAQDHIRSWILQLRDDEVELREGPLGQEAVADQRTLDSRDEALALCESWCLKKEAEGFVRTRRLWMNYDENTSEDNFILPPMLEGMPPPEPMAMSPSLLRSLGLSEEEIETRQRVETAEHAILAGDVEGVRAALDQGYDVNQADDPVDGRTPLALALAAGQLQVAQLLSARGGRLRPAPDDDERLHQQLLEAIREDDMERVKTSIEAGADVQARPHDPESPIETACGAGRPEILQLILDAGADPHRTFEPPLVGPALDGSVQMAELLVEAGADVDRRDEDGDTALYFAAQEGHRAMVDFLLSRGARPEASTHSPADAAASEGHQEIAEMLEQLEG